MGLHDEKPALTPAWQNLHDLVPTSERKAALIGLLRFASACDIAPDEVDATLLDGFEAWCTTRQLKRDIGDHVRRTASNWTWARDHVAGWPRAELKRRDMRVRYTIPLDQYPTSFQTDVGEFLDVLGADPRETMLAEGIFAPLSDGLQRPARALKPRSVQSRREHIRAAAAALVLTGTPIECITTLQDLVMPLAHAKQIVTFYLERRKASEAGAAHATAPSQLIGIIDVLRQIAKFHCRLDEAHVAQIATWKARVTPPQQGAMSEQNATRLRALLEPQAYAKMLHLPQHLLRQAEALWQDARRVAPEGDVAPPAAAARLVMFAVALEILLFCPLRRHNLIQLDIHADLIRATPKAPPGRLLVRASSTKTGEAIDWPIPPHSAQLIDDWLKHYRPVLAPPGNSFLFPGQDKKSRNEAEFANYLSDLVEEQIGAAFNMHLARHFAVVRYLRANPGQYATVSRLLQHKKIETTIRFYAGLETDAAASQANRLLDAERAQTRGQARAAFKPQRQGTTRAPQMARGHA